MQQASQSMQQASAQAQAGQPAAAQQSLAQAQQSMAQAQAAMSMSASAAPGPASSQPPGSPSQALAQNASEATEPGQTTPQEQMGDRASNGPAGPLGSDGRSAYVGLPQRDRQAIMQSQNEKYPEEFGPEIERYLKQLAEQSQAK